MLGEKAFTSPSECSRVSWVRVFDRDRFMDVWFIRIGSIYANYETLARETNRRVVGGSDGKTLLLYPNNPARGWMICYWNSADRRGQGSRIGYRSRLFISILVLEAPFCNALGASFLPCEYFSSGKPYLLKVNLLFHYSPFRSVGIDSSWRRHPNRYGVHWSPSDATYVIWPRKQHRLLPLSAP